MKINTCREQESLLYYSPMTVVTPEKSELRQLKAELVLRGWTLVKLAGKAGFAYGTVRNVQSGQHRGWGAKSAINSALGREIFVQPRTGPVARENGHRRPNGQMAGTSSSNNETEKT
jgi:hypothetical protein